MTYINKLRGLIAFLLLINTFAFSADRYWVGGSGTWSDITHWSTTSGGASGASIPNSSDNVFFDGNSFFSSGEIVKITGTVACNNFTWTATGDNPTLKGKKSTDLEIYGSLNIADNISNTFAGTIHFLGTGTNSISSSVDLYSNIIFESSGTWDVNSNLTTSKAIELVQGTVKLNDINLTADEFSTTNSLTRALYLNSSKVTVNKWYFNETQNLTFDSGDSKIIFLGKEKDLQRGGLFYNMITNIDTRAWSIETQVDTVPLPDASNCMGAITVTVTDDGVSDYLYRVVDGVTLTVIESSGVISDKTWTSSAILEDGTYTLYVNRMTPTSPSFYSPNFTISVPDFETSISVVDHASCVYFNGVDYTSTTDAHLEANHSNGVSPYTYSWNNGGGTNKVTVDVGIQYYSCVVTDGNGCKDDTIATLSYVPEETDYINSGGPDVFIFDPNPADNTASCSDDSNGSITLAATGGSTPYSYSVTDDGVAPSYVAGADFTGLTSGNTYDVWIKDNNGCEVQGTDITIGNEPAPSADAGPATDAICETESYALSSASVSNEASILWTTSGDGSFIASADIVNPTYLPGPNDISSGTVTLTLTVAGNSNCADATDDLVLTINASPSADAGNNETICETGSVLITTASAANNNGLEWTSSGNGIFTGGTLINPSYNPSVDDITAGSVTLTLRAFGNGSCADATSDMTLTIIKSPVVSPGPDTTICQGLTYSVAGSSVINHAGFAWSTSGSGTFDNENILNPIYTPSVADETAGSVDLTLTATANAPCANVAGTMTLSINVAPTADAGDNETICETGSVFISTASASDYESLLWTSSGSGTFVGEALINPNYTPSAADITTGSVTLTLTASSSGCNDAIDNMTLNIELSPVADAGLADAICEDEILSISDASASNHSSVLWTSSGSGTFTGDNTLTPTYDPSAADITAGSVTLTLTANPISTCVAAQSTKDLTINVLPTVDAGPVDNVCEGNDYSVSGASASNQDGLSWSTSGTGTFVDGTTLNPTYTPSVDDITAGSITLTLTASGIGTCTDQTDNFVLTIIPTPIADAGSDATICETETHTLSDASVLNNSDILWSTSGDGTFNATNIQNPVYTPGASDKTAGTVDLTVTAIGNAPCGFDASTMTLTVNPLPTLDAGLAEAVCEGVAYTVSDASASNNDGLSWAHDGLGTLTNGTTISPSYTPSAGDAGSIVTLTLTASGFGTCADQQDTKALTVNPDAIADAGSDAEICDSDTYTISDASASNYSSLEWTSGGDGTFDNDAILGSKYTPGASDISAGSATLTLTAYGANGCQDAISIMVLTLTPSPTVDAGIGGDICKGDDINVSGASAASHGGLLWTSSGTGSFVNETTLTPTYTPSVADQTAGNVTLTLTATGLATCADESAVAVFNFLDLPTAEAGNNETVCAGSDLSVSTALATNYSSLLWTSSGTGTFSGESTLTPTYIPSAADITAGSVTLTLTVTSASCGSAVDNMTLTIESAPTADAGLADAICEDEILSVSDASATNYSSVEWTTSGNGTFTNENTLTPTYDPSVPDIATGSVTLTLTAYSLSVCPDAQDTKLVTINSLPTLDAGPADNVCEGNDYTVSGASASDYDGLSWSSSGTGTFADGTTLTPTYTPSANDITAGSVTLTLTASGIGTCTDQTDNFVLTIISAPIADAGSDATICETETHTLSDASVQNNSDILWSTAGDGTFDATNIQNPVYTPGAGDITSGTVDLTITAIGNAPCGFDASTMTLIINSLPTIDAGAPEAVCEGVAFTISDATASDHDGLSWIHDGSGTLIDETTISPTYTPSAGDAGSLVTLTLTASGLGTCADQVDTKVLTVNPDATADAGSDAEICDSDSYLISDASASNYSSLKWTGGDGTFDSDAIIGPQYSPGATDISTGSVTLTLTAYGANGCQNAVGTMVLTLTPSPTVDAGTGGDICKGSDISVSGASASSHGGLLWTSSGTGTFVDEATLTPTYTPSAADLTAGTVTLTLTAKGLATCADESADAIYNFLDLPTAEAGDNETVCAGNDLSVSTANAANYASLLWTSDGTGVFADETTLTPTYTPSATDITAGTVTLTLTATSASCGDATDNMTLTIEPAPIADAGLAADICEDEILNVDDATASNYGSLLWTSDGTGTFTDETTLTPAYDPSAADITAGSVTLTLTANSLSVCPNVQSTKDLTINSLPIIDAGPADDVCEGNDYTVAGASATNYDGLSWASDGTGVFADGATLTPTYTPSADDITAGSVTLTLTASGIGTCTDQTDNFVLTIIPAPITDAGSDATICETETHTLSDASVLNNSDILWSTAGDGTFDAANIQNPVYTPGAGDIAAGAVVLTITAIGNAPCGFDASTMTLTINSLPSIDAGAPETVCEGVAFTVSDASAADHDGLSWAHDGSGTLIDETTVSPTYTPSAGDAGGVVNLTLTASGLGTCADQVDTKVLTVNPDATADAGSDAEICDSDTYTINDAVATNYSSLEWTSNGDGVFDNNAILGPKYTSGAGDISAGSATLTLTAYGANGCQDAVGTMVLTLTPSPTVDAGTGGDICKGSDISVSGASATSHDGLLWTSSGTGTFADETTLTPTYTPSAADLTAGTVTLTLTAAGLATCADESADAIYNLLDAPTVDAGSDATVCSNGSHFIFDATAFNYSSLLWETNGDGVISDPSLPFTSYVPGINDSLNGTVTLTLNAYANAPCADSLDTKVLTIERAPHASIGLINEVCYGSDVMITSADTVNSSSLQWFTSGDGSFDNDFSLNPTYTPSPADLNNGSVNLTLRAYGNAPCGFHEATTTINFSSEMTVAIGQPSPYFVNATTDISVCISGKHELVRQIGFYLIAPDGTTEIELDKAPVEEGYSGLCGGKDFQDLCFTTSAVSKLDMCSVPKPLTGTYAPNEDWSKIYGQDPAQGGWAVEVRDYVSGYIGTLEEVNITFSDNDINGVTIPITFSSGAISIPIVDADSTRYTVPMGLSTSCFGLCDAHAIVSVIGGSGVYDSYIWSEPSIPSLNEVDLCAGTFSVEVTDSKGCKATGEVTVIEPDSISIDFPDFKNILCKGDSTGFAVAKATNGFEPYSYYWTSKETDDTARALVAGKSYVTVTDYNSCEMVDSIIINEPAEKLTFTLDSTDVSCYGLSDGSAYVVASGGTLTGPDYTYAWSTGESVDSITNLPAGKYNVTVSDDNGCVAIDSIEVVEPDSMYVAISDSANILCFEDSTGYARAMAYNGNGSFTYLWNDGNTTADPLLENIPAGTYKVIATDIKGCKDSVDVALTEPAELTAQFTDTTHLTCFNTTDGSATITPAGGAGDFTYLWSNGDTDSTAFNLLAGDVSVIVSDANGCRYYDTVTIEVPDTIKTTVLEDSPVQCFSDSNGVATVTAFGGTGILTYVWDNGETTVQADSMHAGYNYITVMDDSACYVLDSIEFIEPAELIIADTGSTEAFCTAANGSAWVIASGGTGILSYNWDNGGNTDSIINLVTGIYTVTVSDERGCKDSIDVQVRDTSDILVYISAPDTSVTCIGGNDGSAVAHVVNGTEPFSFAWSPNVGTTDTIENLAAGDYQVTVTDADGCSDVASVTITEDSVLQATTTVFANVSCAGNTDGIAKVYALFGSGGYTYEWDNGETTDSVSNLSVGIHEVTVTDIAGCDTIVSVVITEPIKLTADIYDFTHVLCTGDSIGIAKAKGINGTPDYTFEWSSKETDSIAKALKAGWSYVKVTDANGCSATDSVFLLDTMPKLVITDIDTTFSSCGIADGFASVKANGGEGTYSYAWSNGVNNDTIENILAGSYTITVTDGFECAEDSTIVISDTSSVTIDSVAITNVMCGSCTGSMEVITVSNGTPDYTYEWSNGSSIALAENLCVDSVYTVTVTDALGCNTVWSDTIISGNGANGEFIDTALISCAGLADGKVTYSMSGGLPPYKYIWSNGDTLATADSLSAGKYYVTVTDANCSYVDSIVFTNPTELQLGFTVTNATCYGLTNGSVAVESNNGITIDALQWANGISDTIVKNVGVGYYSVTATYNGTCTFIDSAQVTQPSRITVKTEETIAASCGNSDGQLVVTALGGKGILSFNWKIVGDSDSVLIGHTKDTLSNIGINAYQVSVTDENLCQTISSPILLSNQGSINLAVDSISHLTCPGVPTGAIRILAEGGSNPYNFEWTSVADETILTDTTNTDTTSLALNLLAGDYKVLATDGSICQAVAIATILDDDVFTVDIIDSTLISCNGLTNGSATAFASKGIEEYSFIWSNGSITETASNLAAGTYYVTATDATGCETTDSVIITEPIALSGLIVNYTDVACANACNGTATFSVTPGTGTAPYSYEWSTGSTTAKAYALCAGEHFITVTDNNNCEIYTSVVINDTLEPLVITSIDTTTAFCGESNAMAIANVEGGVEPYRYRWYDNSTDDTLKNLSVGIYNIAVTDDNGCVVGKYFAIDDTSNLSIDEIIKTDIACGDCTGAMEIETIAGGTPEFTYSWSNGDSDTLAEDLCAGQMYTVTVTDVNGCAKAHFDSISNNNQLDVTLTIDSIISCTGMANAVVSASVEGGEGDYTYQWSNGDTLATADSLAAGWHQVIVSDENCFVVDSILIDDAEDIQLSTIGVDVSCGGEASGSAIVSVLNGITPDSYLWSNDSTGSRIENVTAGKYYVTVEYNGYCSSVDSVEINEPTPIVFTITDSIASCGNNDGMLSVVASGGSGSLTYNWSIVGNADSVLIDAINDTLANIGVDAYQLAITDATGCTVLSDAIILGDDGDIVIDSIEIQGITCIGREDGRVAVLPQSALAPFTYDWWSFNNSSYVIDDTSSTANAGIADSLASGMYKVYITNKDTCTAVALLEVTEDNVLATSIQNIVGPSCNSGVNGQAEVIAVNGTPYTSGDSYTYAWSNGVITSLASNLAEGQYKITVTDSSNCIVIDSVTIAAPTPLVSEILDSVETICYSDILDSITVSASGGTEPYSFTWNDGQSGATVYDLEVGIHIVTITDANKCTSIIDTLKVIKGGEYYATFDTTYTECADSIGTAKVIVVGGTAPFEYEWNTGEIVDSISKLWVDYYNVTVTDAEGCELIDTVKIEDKSNVDFKVTKLHAIRCAGMPVGVAEISDTSGGAGNYSFLWENGDTRIKADSLREGFIEVRVFDKDQCTGLDRIFMSSDSVLAIDYFGTTNDISCDGSANGSARVYVTGGVQFENSMNYQYQWDRGINDTIDRINNLKAGMFTVTVSDSAGCSVADSIEIFEAPLKIEVVDVTDIQCFGYNTGSITVKAIDGFGSPATFAWSNGEDSTTVDSLIAGDYTVTVTELGNDCEYIETITVKQPADFGRTFTLKQLTGCADSTGIAELAITGGTAPFTYVWSNGDTDSILNNIWADMFHVTVTDANGCIVIDSVRMKDDSKFSVAKGNTNLIKCNGMFGSMTVIPKDGIRPYTYEWSHNASVNDSVARGLTEGIYKVTVTDDSSCVRTINLGLLDEPDKITVNFESDGVVKCYEDYDTIIAHVSGGSPDYTFEWFNDTAMIDDTDSILDSVPSGNYKIYITDIEGCTSDTAFFTLGEPDPIYVDFTIERTGCVSKKNTGYIEINNITGSHPPFTFSWNANGLDSKDSVLENLYDGIYVLTVKDSVECTQNFVPNISPLKPNSVTILNTVRADCEYNSPTGELKVVNVGIGVPPYTYSWTGNGLTEQTTETATGLLAGVYNLNIMGANECANNFKDTVKHNVQFTPRIKSELGGNGIDTICETDSLQLEAQIQAAVPLVTNSSNITYRWYTDQGYNSETMSATDSKKIKVCPDSLTSYYMTITYEGCVSAPEQFTVFHRDKIGLNVDIYLAGAIDDEDSVEILQGVPVELKPNEPWFINKFNEVDGFITYQYKSFDENLKPNGYTNIMSDEQRYLETDSFSIVVVPESSMFYTITAASRYGCKEYDTILIKLADELIIPSGFSPNDDGQNDKWVIPYTKLTPDCHVMVYNRWGVKIYDKDKDYYEEPWDGTNKNGKDLPMGTYYYFIEFNDTEGTDPKAGSVTIIR